MVPIPNRNLTLNLANLTTGFVLVIYACVPWFLPMPIMTLKKPVASAAKPRVRDSIIEITSTRFDEYGAGSSVKFRGSGTLYDLLGGMWSSIRDPQRLKTVDQPDKMIPKGDPKPASYATGACTNLNQPPPQKTWLGKDPHSTRPLWKPRRTCQICQTVV